MAAESEGPDPAEAPQDVQHGVVDWRRAPCAVMRTMELVSVAGRP